MTRRWNNKGALLLETLLAVCILSVGLSALIQVLASLYRAEILNSDYLDASRCRENKMFELLINHDSAKELESSLTTCVLRKKIK